MEMEENEKKWTTLDSEYLMCRPWLTVRKDKVRMAKGTVIDDFYVLEYPEWVNTIAITTDGRFVMVKQYRHGIGATNYELCAGCCEDGETFEQSARRELLEETGYAGGEWSLLLEAAPNATSMSNHIHCFLATGVEKVAEPDLDPTEELEVALLDEQEVFGLLSSGQIVQATMVAPLWKYFYGRSR